MYSTWADFLCFKITNADNLLIAHRKLAHVKLLDLGQFSMYETQQLIYVFYLVIKDSGVYSVVLYT